MVYSAAEKKRLDKVALKNPYLLYSTAFFEDDVLRKKNMGIDMRVEDSRV